MNTDAKDKIDSSQKTIREFSRFANQYNSYNQIQSLVAKELISLIDKNRHYITISDIGSGTGLAYEHCIKAGVNFDTFFALDASHEMLNVHPDATNCQKIVFDFNNADDLSRIARYKYDMIISSSALQWATNLDITLSYLSKTSHNIMCSLFTNTTFESIHKITRLNSPLRSLDEYMEIFDNHYSCKYSICSYKLYFESKEDMFKYIKRSGVSGGKNQMGYKDTKSLIVNYPLDYLEFEVLFVNGVVQD